MRHILLTLGLAGLPAILASAPPARAQSALCPTSIAVQGDPNQTGFGLQNGACTNGRAGAFSGAALATQALSDLSQSTTQETNRNTSQAVSDRREAERQRCAPGLTRIDGICQRPPAAAPERAAAPSRTERPRRARSEARAEREPAMAPEVHRSARRVTPKPEAAPRREAYRAPSSEERVRPVRPLISKDGPPPVLPVVALPEGPRFAAWATGFGDYQRLQGRGLGNIQCCFAGGVAGQPNGLILDVRSSTTTAGFTGGIDVTGRNLIQAGDGIVTGFLTGYITTDLNITTRSLPQNPRDGTVIPGFGQLRANLQGPSLGYFATYFNGPFSADFTYKADLLDLNERFVDTLAFTAQPNVSVPGTFFGPERATFLGGGRTSLTTHSLIGNVNYRIPVSPALWVEPTAGLQYTATNYGRGAANLGLDNADLLRLQGGLRLGSTFATENGVLVTTSLSGLAYSNVFINGGFLQGGTFDQNNILARADEGKVRGLGILNLALDYPNGFSWFLQGSVRGGENLFGAGGRAGVRYQW